jgi:predicted cupin superfamily sugar epimerase/SAM-dependent methyltransferase
MNATDIIQQLGLSPHPEGGWYRETWRAPAAPGERAASTAIWFLLEAGQRSHWHRVDASEIWLWHAGAPLMLRTAATDAGPVKTLCLGPALPAGELPQQVIAPGHWQAAEAREGWALVSCVVAPAFEFPRFELAPAGWEPRPAVAEGGRSHWENVYHSKAATQVSWYRPHLDVSLSLLQRFGPGPQAALIDVGSGASTLVDDLVAEGYVDLTVLDLSASALDVVRQRLAAVADRIEWYAEDVRDAPLPAARYDLWHDRAVFHFLTQAADREAYVRQVLRACRPGAHVVLGTFALDGPLKCSGLDVQRYDAAGLQAALGPRFELLHEEREQHTTPWGTSQSFQYAVFRLRAAAGLPSGPAT